MKVLITGASGLLGRAIKLVFDGVSEWTVQGLAYSHLDGGLKKVDLRNENEIITAINEFRPDVVIHSAAERRPDFVANHEEETVKLNVLSSETLAKEVNKYGGFVLYISTDYVFDGKSAPYSTKDEPNPLNKYGMTKLQGEQAVLNNCTRSGVLRVPMLYGDLKYISESAVTYLFPILQDSSKVTSVSNYEQRYPTSTYDIAIVCRQIIEHYLKNETFSGIWHWRGNDKLTKYGMIKIMSKIFQLPMEHIQPSNEPPNSSVSRPYDCELDCSDLEQIGISQRTSFEENIKTCLIPFL